MMSTNNLNYQYSELYAYLNEGIALHTCSRENFLICLNPPILFNFSKDMMNFLMSCDGTFTIGDLLIENLYNKNKIYEKETLNKLLMISSFIKHGVIILTKKPIPKKN
jgi:hypothetical protein